MGTHHAPALLPCLLFVAGTALARSLVWAPIGALAVLVALGAALGGRGGRALAAAAIGLLAGRAGLDGPPPFRDPSRPVEASGRICSHPLRFGARSSVTLCADRLRRGREVVVGRWVLRLDLPEGAAAPLLGTRLRATGALSRTPGYENRFRSPAGRWSLRVKSLHFVRIERPPPVALELAARARARVEAGWRVLGAQRPGVALGRALALGDTSAAPERWARALRRTGLAHLTAVSGFNVALVAGWALLVGALLPARARVPLAALAALGYLGLVGPAPSLVRATAMALVAGVALLAGRSPLALQALALVTAALAARDPGALSDVGLQLSIAATAGLIVGTRRLEAGLSPLPKLAARALAASLAAQSAASPVAVAAFGQASLAAPLFNLLFATWAALVLVLGLAAAALGAVASGSGGQAALAGVAAAAVVAGLDLATLPLEWLCRLPPSPWISAPVTPDWACGAVVGAGLAALAMGPRARRGLALVLLLLAGAAPPAPPEAPAEIVVLDVGQGDAILIRAGDRALLIDGGGARGRDLALQVLVPALAAREIHRLDAVVLSHFDHDHCAGLVDLAGYLPMAELWVPRGARPTPCSRELEAAAAAPVRALAAGDRLALGAARIEVLHPERHAAPAAGNARSLALAIELAGRRLLLLADLDGDGERSLVRRYGSRLASDIVKVAHHGAAGSSTSELLAAARPRLALVSAGARNAYGHPAPRALDRLVRGGALVLRTDRDGAVEVAWRPGGPWRIALPGSPRRDAPPGG